MKYKIFFPIVLLLTLEACSNSSSTHRKVENLKSAEKSIPDKKKNIVRKHVSIPRHFSYLTNMGSIDVIYTQGDYSMDVEGDSAMLEYLITDFDSNLFTVAMRLDSNPDINVYGNASHVRLFFSCPDLKCVSICGNGSFESHGQWRTDDLQLGVLGTGSFNIEQVECNTFDLQSTDIGKINIADLRAEDATIYSRSSADITAHVNVKNLTILNDGTQTFHLTGTAANTVVKNPKDERLFIDLQK